MGVGVMDQNVETMMSQLPIKFLQQKIQELQSALFFPETGSLLQIPTHVIPTAEADDEGDIWFIIPRPAQHIDEADMEFPARLEFFKKGKGFYLKVQGKAHMVSQFDQIKCPDLSSDLKTRIENKQVLAVRIKILSANYFESVPPASSNWITSSKNQFVNWLLNPQYNDRSPQLITIPISIDQ